MKTRILIMMLVAGGTFMTVSAQQQPKGKAPVVKTVPKNAKATTYKGVKYQVVDGKYYKPVSGGYEEVSAPPVGIQVDKVPTGFQRKEHKGVKYYYKDNVYYKEVKGKFEVCAKPW
ncbi:MAG: hypothetical protein H6Q26_782 [Bacteroidetes bacterium]|uniref:DUF6515 family protein n=1 Tax=Chitinophaga sp. LS1 TaxID=3051176 RepID=UPI001E11F2FB|nr:DUF6515 family protein [Chitinophaga sp. LS1]MBP1650625.1 hypothetical protein [Bacteroidota bacterium]WPV65334.1 DUF6515 family protein [Chitinophaga sp. LS1]